MSERRKNLNTIQSLQAGRGLAAVAVVFHHAHYGGRDFGTRGDSVFRPFDSFYLGVDFFFVLSGFIIYHSTVGRGRSAADYGWARFRRVFLPYWPIGIMMAVLKTLMPDVSRGSVPWSWFTSVTLAPLSTIPALSVAWTLQYEVFFYLLFGCLYFTGFLRSGLVVWGALILIAAFAGVRDVFPLTLFNLEFIMGIVIAILYRAEKGHPALLLAAPIPFVIWLQLADGHFWSFLPGLSLALLILPIAQLERQGKFTVPWILTFLGGASYSIYLVHQFAISLADRVLEGNSYAFMVAVNVVWGIGIGLLYYWLVERPLLRVAPNDPRHERLTGAEPLPAALSEVLEASPRSSERRPKRPKA